MADRFLERCAYWGIRIGQKSGSLAIRLLPRQFLFCLSNALADIGFYLFRGFRVRSIRNYRLALGERNGRSARGAVRSSLRNFFRDFIEVGIALETPEAIRAEIPIVGRENLETALAKGKGVVALGAHLGNFFLIGSRLAGEGYSANVLINHPRHGRLGRLLDHYRLKVGQKTIHARPRRVALGKLVQVLRQNELAIIIADEYRAGSGIRVPFFGHTVLARRGPATLALRTGAAIVPINLIREPGGGLRLIIEPELELLRSGRTAADVRENTLRMTQWLERTVTAYPDQWNWMNVHWQEIAEGAVVAKEQRFHGLAP